MSKPIPYIKIKTLDSGHTVTLVEQSYLIAKKTDIRCAGCCFSKGGIIGTTDCSSSYRRLGSCGSSDSIPITIFFHEQNKETR